MPLAHVVVDYQNIHLTAHGYFCPEGEAPHLCLIHPLHFANQVLHQRNLIKRLLAERSEVEFEPATLASVRAFRGQPSNARDATAYRRTQAHQSEWTRDPRVKVTYRTLKYDQQGAAREKGIDVMVALEVVQLAAQSNDGQIVILAAHDTDQEPALELGFQLIGNRLETAGWDSMKQLRVPGARIWHTKLRREHFEKCIDQRDYT